ncbi:MAG: DNA methyltransferase [Candidatus Altarchaeum sp.]|nr:DNA methyltransferase [Candidatus Altarchaeum sp.]
MNNINEIKIKDQIFNLKKRGLTDQEIGEKFNVNLHFIEKVIIERLGINVSNPSLKKRIKTSQPKDFSLETTTVWSFKSRGAWATHNGNYRGNWSPYLPRNVILRYSKPGELVLDCFCGAGTTGIECKLIGRNFIGIDINPNAIELAKENISFQVSNIYSNNENGDNKTPFVKFKIGDARDLSFISDNSIDLICAHPPYANIIQYTNNQKKDLSFCDVDEFLNEMSAVAKENYRTLKDGGYCAILIGDMRRHKSVIPLGFKLIDVYLKNGFSVKELVIKRQHNCKTTGFWYKNSIKYNFLLLAHEYLAIFKKTSIPQQQRLKEVEESENENFYFKLTDTKQNGSSTIESSTVWIFEFKNWFNKTIQNLIGRYDGNNYYLINKTDDFNKLDSIETKNLIIAACNNKKMFKAFCGNIDKVVKQIRDKGYLAILCNDMRFKDGTIYPMAIETEKFLENRTDLKIKEIVVISIENNHNAGEPTNKDLKITFKYLLIYNIIKEKK